ncbi:diguanylate cyclase [Solidesulfovibrio sp.]|uniref:diguanylate cyclase n=1 Tax=Solidesulfovibrio sp. TaxID=2910990 RepID=UPI002B203F50|nr:diguanylate cyclase [Solidesulfovibrio sp.]MEA4858358.1 diguanylate cyclase [Solidesulfovibrio sp.]
MKRIPFSRRIGTKIIGLYLLALLPLVTVIAALNVHLRQDALDRGRSQLLRLAYEAAGAQETMVHDLTRLLRNFVALPEVQDMDLPALDAILRRRIETRPAVSNMFVCDPRGEVVASARKPFAGLNSAHRRYFREAVAATGLVAGEYLIGRVTGNPVLHFSLAIPGPGGAVRGVAVVSLDLRALSDAFARIGLPAGVRAATLDVRGNVLARYPDSGALLPEDWRRKFVREALAGEQASGTVLARREDGVEMIRAYKALRLDGETAGPYGLVLVGMPVSSALGQARDMLLVSAGVSVGSLCLAVGLVVVLGRGRIGRRLEVLAGFAASLTEDRVCRLPPRFGHDEIGLLGERLVEMSCTLHEKNERLAEAMASLGRERDQLSTVVGQLREAHDALERLASQDCLTGLRNRRCFNEKMLVELDRFVRYGTPFSLVLFDIDDFKRINDTYGHPFGDEVLRRLGYLTLGMVRSVDEAYRIGGEEFALILPETEGENARVLAERLRERVAAQSVAADPETAVRFTVSLGVAQAHTGVAEAKDLFAVADNALYKAKRTGKNRSVLVADSSAVVMAS